MTKISSEINEISIEKILPNPNQPRRHFDPETLNELADSIKSYGLISPIQVRQIGSDVYELVAGERRLRACKLAGIKTIPAIVIEISEADSAVIAIVENIQRDNLSFFEEAQSYYQLMQYYKMTQEQIARVLGKSQSFVANKIRLLKLSPEVMNLITENRLSERHARALLRIPDESLQKEIIEKVKDKDLTVKKTEDLIEKYRHDILTNNYDETITKEKKARTKSFINVKIYLNTIKSAFKMVKDSKKDAEYKEIDNPDYVEIKIKIPK